MIGPIVQSWLPKRCNIRGTYTREGKSFHISCVLLEGGISSTITPTRLPLRGGENLPPWRRALANRPAQPLREVLPTRPGGKFLHHYGVQRLKRIGTGEILPPSRTVDVPRRGGNFSTIVLYGR